MCIFFSLFVCFVFLNVCTLNGRNRLTKYNCTKITPIETNTHGDSNRVGTEKKIKIIKSNSLFHFVEIIVQCLDALRFAYCSRELIQPSYIDNYKLGRAHIYFTCVLNPPNTKFVRICHHLYVPYTHTYMFTTNDRE